MRCYSQVMRTCRITRKWCVVTRDWYELQACRYRTLPHRSGKICSMSRPVNPRSRSAAARILSVPESTLRNLQSRGILEPVSDWGATDLAWAKVATTPGVDAESLPPVPKRIAPHDWLVIPTGSAGASVTVPSSEITQVVTDFSSSADSPVPVMCLPVGEWATGLGSLWLS